MDQEFVNNAQLSIIENQLEQLEEEYESLTAEDVDRRNELEEQIEVWQEARADLRK